MMAWVMAWGSAFEASRVDAAQPFRYNRPDQARLWAQIHSFTYSASDSNMFVLIEPLFTTADTTAAYSGMNAIEQWMINPQGVVANWRDPSVNGTGAAPEAYDFTIRKTTQVGLWHDHTAGVVVVMSYWNTINENRHATLTGTFTRTDVGVRNTTFIIPANEVMFLPIAADSIQISQASAAGYEIGMIMW
jgi:hypothetical protein